MSLSILRRGPWCVLLPLLAIQFTAITAFALTVRHNGWLFYQGGDQTWYYTSSWALAHGTIPDTSIGWAWPYALTPVSSLAGKSFLDAIPAIIVLQCVLLLPALLVGMYSIGARIAGRRFGYWVAAVWVAAPFVAILGFDPRYHDRWVEQFLPQALGLTGLGDFPSMALTVVVAALVLRAIQENDRVVLALAGILGGFLIGLKPGNTPLLVGVALALLAARRLRFAALFAACLVPALVTLVLWKERGLGTVPLFAFGAVQLAAGAGGLSGWALTGGGLPVAGVNISRYVNLDWGQLNHNFISLREYFWSPRLLEALPLAGAIGIVRRSLPAMALLVGWFGAYLVLKGTSQFATVDSGSFFRLLMPSLPAYVLLIAAVPLLVPRLRRAVAPGRMAARAAGPARTAVPRPRLVLGTALALLAVAPFLLVVASSRLPARAAVRTQPDGGYVAVSNGFAAQATVGGAAVSLSWQPATRPWLATISKVIRNPADPFTCPPSSGVVSCWLSPGTIVTMTRGTTAVDHPGKGRWWYTVGTVANWLNDPTKGDLMLVSPPVEVVVR